MCDHICNSQCICPALASLIPRAVPEPEPACRDNPDSEDIVLWEFLTQLYISYYNPDVHAPDSLYPTGHVCLTSNVAEALRFATEEDVRVFVLQQSKVSPLRPDGSPNRPLAAWTLSIERVPSCAGGAL